MAYNEGILYRKIEKIVKVYEFCKCELLNVSYLNSGLSALMLSILGGVSHNSLLCGCPRHFCRCLQHPWQRGIAKTHNATPDVVAQAFNFSSWAVETGRSL